MASAALGRQMAALLDPERPVIGVTLGAIRPELRQIAVIARQGGGSLDPNAGDLDVTARWGYRNSSGATMAGPGRAVNRAYSDLEQEAIKNWGNPLGLSLEETFAPLGDTTYDIFLNEQAYWRNVPAKVWAYTLAGYQMMKKWLSYREYAVLGRSLTDAEGREVRDMARRIAAILLLDSKISANYHVVQMATYDWAEAASSEANTLRLW
jgi:hypothetical protein